VAPVSGGHRARSAVGPGPASGGHPAGGDI